MPSTPALQLSRITLSAPRSPRAAGIHAPLQALVDMLVVALRSWLAGRPGLFSLPVKPRAPALRKSSRARRITAPTNAPAEREGPHSHVIRTLRAAAAQWLAEEQPSVPEVLRVLIEASAALAAVDKASRWLAAHDGLDAISLDSTPGRAALSATAHLLNAWLDAFATTPGLGAI